MKCILTLFNSIMFIFFVRLPALLWHYASSWSSWPGYSSVAQVWEHFHHYSAANGRLGSVVMLAGVNFLQLKSKISSRLSKDFLKVTGKWLLCIWIECSNISASLMGYFINNFNSGSAPILLPPYGHARILNFHPCDG